MTLAVLGTDGLSGDYAELSKPGEYVLVSSTPEEPQYLTVRSTVKRGTGIQSFTVKVDQYQSNPDAEDDRLNVYFVVNGRNIVNFTEAQITAAIAECEATWLANKTAILQGRV